MVFFIVDFSLLLSLCFALSILFLSFVRSFIGLFVLFLASASSRAISTAARIHTCTFTEFTFSFFSSILLLAVNSLCEYFIYTFSCNLSLFLFVCVYFGLAMCTTTVSLHNKIEWQYNCCFCCCFCLQTHGHNRYAVFLCCCSLVISFLALSQSHLKLCWYFGFCVLEWVNESFLFCSSVSLSQVSNTRQQKKTL